MSGLRVLITNNTLATRAGTELYVRDLATGLLERGHSPFAYSPVLGEVAEELRAATIPVVDNLDNLAVEPDVIHGHHHFETMTALLRFPSVPAVSFCHGWVPWEEAPPRSPRVLRYVAVSELCRERLAVEHAIPEDKIRLLYNFVDLKRFTPRPPLPQRPQRALIFSNYARDHAHIETVRLACEKAGIQLDVRGQGAGNATPHPERILRSYDIVFAVGRSAIEALAVGSAVILCDAASVGPMVTSGEIDRLRRLNFAIRALREPLQAEAIFREIGRYNSEDAANVSAYIRANAGREGALDQIVSLYEEVRAEYARTPACDLTLELKAASSYLQWMAPRIKQYYQLNLDCLSLRAEAAAWEQNVNLLHGEIQALHNEIRSLQEKGYKREQELQNRLDRMTRTLGWRLMSMYGPVKHRLLLPTYRRVKKTLRI